MKKLVFIILYFATSDITFAQSELPDTQIKEVSSGKKVAFNEIFEKGKVTIVNVWATWCVPCKKEIKNISLKMSNWKKEADFNYLTISIDESRAEGMVRSYAISQGWNFPNYIDLNSDLKRSLNFQSCPYSFIVDKFGKIAYTHVGYEEGAENELFDKVKELTKQ